MRRNTPEEIAEYDHRHATERSLRRALILFGVAALCSVSASMYDTYRQAHQLGACKVQLEAAQGGR